MRRSLFTLLATSIMGMVVGCCSTHGVCDCSCDFENNCGYREPWVTEAASVQNTPAPLPEVREALPNGAKKL